MPAPLKGPFPSCMHPRICTRLSPSHSTAGGGAGWQDPGEARVGGGGTSLHHGLLSVLRSDGGLCAGYQPQQREGSHGSGRGGGESVTHRES